MSPHRPATPSLTHVAAVVATVAVLVAGWLLGHQGSAVTPAAAATTSTPSGQARDGVLVSGTGKVTGKPDTLVADFGTEAEAASVDEALRRADRALARIRASLLAKGVERADLQTAGLDIYPQYDNSGNHVTGYQAQQQLTVTIHDIDRAGELLGAAVHAGGDATRLSGLTFRIDDDSALLAEARRNAFADAKAKAQLYGEQAGRGLSRVVSVTETVNGADTPYPYEKLAAAASDAARSVAVEPGQQQLSVTVTVEWAFG
jgi:uncharacterized protein YggE